MARQRTHVITSLKMQQSHIQRLNELSAETGLSTSAVMRMLIENARIGRVSRREPVATIRLRQPVADEAA
jgi:hypothetical protein